METTTQKEYWKPSVTADIVAVAFHQAPHRDNGTYVNLVLIRRSDKSEAYPNCWALPGGFLDKGESIPECAARELKEETGLEAGMLAPIGVFSNPNRDPRSQVISNAFLSVFVSTNEQPLGLKAGDDAKEIALFRLKGKFSRKDGSLDVQLYNHISKEKIEFHATFSRGAFGLLNTSIDYRTDTRLAFDHAEILARTILRSPDIVMPTAEKPVDDTSDADAEMK